MSRRKFGTVRRLASGRWQARVPGPNGELLPAPQTFATSAEASRYLASVETDIARGLWVDPRGSSVLLADYSRAWLQERTVRGRSLAARTIDTYHHSLNAWILPTLGGLPLDRITSAHVRRWHAEVSSQTGATAVRQAYAVLRAVLNTAVEDEALHRNPCRIKGAGQAHTPERPLLGLDEVEALVAAMPAHLETLTTLAFWAHTRLGEVLALRCSDVLLEKSQLRIERQVVEVDGYGSRITEPKAGSRRVVTLPEPAVEVLRQHLASQPPGPPGCAAVYSARWQRAACPPRSRRMAPSAAERNCRRSTFTTCGMLG